MESARAVEGLKRLSGRLGVAIAGEVNLGFDSVQNGIDVFVNVLIREAKSFDVAAKEIGIA